MSCRKKKPKQIKEFRSNSLAFFRTNSNGLLPRPDKEALSYATPGSPWRALYTERFFLRNGLPVCTIFRLCNRPYRGWHFPVWTWRSTHQQGPKRPKKLKHSKLFLNNCRHLPNALACEQAIILISPSARARLRPREIERPKTARAGERSTRGGRDPDKLPASRLFSNFPPVRETRVRQR